MQRGGSGVLGTEVVLGLAALGHRLRALAPLAAAATADIARFAARHPDVPTTWIPVPARSSDLLEGSRSEEYRQAEDEGIRARLPDLIAERRPDVILINRESAIGSVPTVARRHGIPTAVLVQGGRTLQRMLERNRDAQARRQLARLRQVDVVIVVAHHLEAALAPLSLRHAIVVPNPVDLDRFSPGPKSPALLRAHGIGARQIVIGHVSNLGPAKRPMDVIESASRALATRPDLLYLIVGDGPYRAPMEARCRELGIAERVRFVGWVDHADVPAYLRLMDIVVMPSEHEGLPLVYLETQASGRVLVACDIPATREVVADGETGLIVRRGDLADLTATTLRAAADPALRSVIGTTARVAVRRHAIRPTLAAYARVLEEVAVNRSREPRVRARARAWTSGDPAERLGADLWALVEAQGGQLVAAAPIGTLRSRLRPRAAFRLRLADGRVLKGRRVNDEASAVRVERLSRLLEPRHFPRLLARRGAALLSEWADGMPVPSTDNAADLCRQVGGLQGRLHRLAASADEISPARERWHHWSRRLEQDLDVLVTSSCIDRATAARAMAMAVRGAPADVDLGLVHGDLCPENLVLHDGVVRVVDTEDLRIYACDHDLARTWLRWPMGPAERQAYYDGYGQHRSWRGFDEHFTHWAVIVLVESASFRLRAGVGDPGPALARLRGLVGSGTTPGALELKAVPAGGR